MAAVAATVVGVIMGMTVVMEMLMLMRMGMVMAVIVRMLMSMGLTVMGVLMSVGVAMLMGVSAGSHIIGKMHIHYSFIWYPLKGVANSVEIGYNRRKSPERRKLLCLNSTIIMTTLTYMPTASLIHTVMFTKIKKR
jgi:hypothetical protein